MTTRQFIEREFAVKGKEKTCSSVFKDGDGNIFSYGYHYPLLFQIGGKTFRNVAGYSVTTAKHINWAGQAVNYDCIDVELPDAFRLAMFYDNSDGKSLKYMENILIDKATELTMEMAHKKRKDTWTFANLQNNLDKVLKSLEEVRA